MSVEHRAADDYLHLGILLAQLEVSAPSDALAKSVERLIAAIENYDPTRTENDEAIGQWYEVERWVKVIRHHVGLQSDTLGRPFIQHKAYGGEVIYQLMQPLPSLVEYLSPLRSAARDLKGPPSEQGEQSVNRPTDSPAWLVHEIFSQALHISEALTPLRGCNDLANAGRFHSLIWDAFRTMRAGLDKVESVKGNLPAAALPELSQLAKIVIRTRTECIGIGDVCQFLADSDLHGPAERGWKAVIAAKPQNQNLYPWASEPSTPMIYLAADPKRKDDSASQDNRGKLPTEPAASETKKSKAEILKGLEKAVRRAYLSQQFAESKKGKELEDNEAYELLKEEGIPDDAGDLGELTDYEPPTFDTWRRYVTEARNALGETRYTKRKGRPRGGSIAKGDEIEFQTEETD